MIVAKLGGSSVDGGERVAGAADLVAARAAELPAGTLAVVVSAMGKTTSELQRLAAQAAKGDLDGARAGLDAVISRHRQALAEAAGGDQAAAWVEEAIAAEAERVGGELDRIATLGNVSARGNDAVVSLGELLSSRLVAAALATRGVPVAWLDPRDLITTDDCFGGAHPDRLRIWHNVRELARPRLVAGETVVTGGYLGRTHGGQTTTMGRESSDLSATLLGAALRAECVEIWTDVDGILTADPRLVPTAKLVPQLSYREAGLLARLGAKVIHPGTVAPAAAVGAEVRIRNRFRPEAPGSTIGREASQQPLWAIAARECLLENARGEVAEVQFPLEGSWALATGYRLGSTPLQLRVGRQVMRRCGGTPRVLVSVVGRVAELNGRLTPALRQALAGLDAVPVPGRGIAVSHLLTLDEAREAVERLHRAAFEEAPWA